MYGGSRAGSERSNAPSAVPSGRGKAPSAVASGKGKGKGKGKHEGMGKGEADREVERLNAQVDFLKGDKKLAETKHQGEINQLKTKMEGMQVLLGSKD